jgi:hypothetical protein
MNYSTGIVGTSDFWLMQGWQMSIDKGKTWITSQPIIIKFGIGEFSVGAVTGITTSWPTRIALRGEGYKLTAVELSGLPIVNVNADQSIMLALYSTSGITNVTLADGAIRLRGMQYGYVAFNVALDRCITDLTTYQNFSVVGRLTRCRDVSGVFDIYFNGEASNADLRIEDCETPVGSLQYNGYTGTLRLTNLNTPMINDFNSLKVVINGGTIDLSYGIPFTQPVSINNARVTGYSVMTNTSPVVCNGCFVSSALLNLMQAEPQYFTLNNCYPV